MRINFQLIPSIFNENKTFLDYFWNLTIKIKMFQFILWQTAATHISIAKNQEEEETKWIKKSWYS